METRQIHSIFYFTCVICLYRLIFGTAEKQNLWCHRGKPLTQQYFWALTLFALSRCVHWACCRSVFVTDTHIWKSHWHDKMVFIALNCFFSLYIHFAFLLDSYTVRLRWCASVLWLFTMFHCSHPRSPSHWDGAQCALIGLLMYQHHVFSVVLCHGALTASLHHHNLFISIPDDVWAEDMGK